MAYSLIDEYLLKGWNFKFDYAKMRFGYCNYTKKIISLSKHLTLLNSEYNVRDTLLHEIAHAIVGKKNNHNNVWKEKAREIGCSATRCFSEEIIIPNRKYIAKCSYCGKEFQSQRKRYRVACASCCNKYNNGKYSKEYGIEFILNAKNTMQLVSGKKSNIY